MAKIKVEHFSVGPIYMFVIDDKGKIWRKAIENGTWTPAGEIPEAPASPETVSIDQLAQ